MYEGKTRVSQRGSDGYKVQTYRKVYDDGKLISNEKEAYSVYKPHEEIVYKGTKVKEPKPEPKPEVPADNTNPAQPGDSTTPADPTAPTDQTQNGAAPAQN